MPQELVLYAATVLAWGVMGLLFIVQLLVVDLAGMRAGHIPGAPVAANHKQFLFRATRAHANTNESIAAFILLSAFAILTQASPVWVNALVWGYVLSRVAHMATYYVDLRLARSIAFGASLLFLFGLFVAGTIAFVR